jgi:hypothetical protein
VARGGGGGRREMQGGSAGGRKNRPRRACERKRRLGLGLGSATASHSWPVGRPEERRRLELGHVARVAGATPESRSISLPDVAAGCGRRGRERALLGFGRGYLPPRGWLPLLGARRR